MQGIYQILIEKNHFSVTCEQFPISVESSVAFITDLTKLDCIDDIKSNDGELMKRHGQALRQAYRDECDDIDVRRKFADEDIRKAIFIFTNM